MSTTRTRFSGLEFQVLWAAAGRDRLPYPLQFRPTAEHHNDVVVQRDSAATALLHRIDDKVLSALHVLAEPEVRVDAFGFEGSGLTSKVRMHAAKRDDAAVLLVQEAGPSSDVGGDVILTGCAASELAGRFVRALPAARPGSRPAVSFARKAVESGDGAALLHGANEATPKQQLRAMFDRERTSIGEVTVYRGAAYDSRPVHGEGFHWIDFAGDGRYLVRNATTISAQPADAAEVANQIESLLRRAGRSA